MEELRTASDHAQEEGERSDRYIQSMLSNSFPHLNNPIAQHNAIDKIWAEAGRKIYQPDMTEVYWHAGTLAPQSGRFDRERACWVSLSERTNYEGKAIENAAKEGIKPFKTKWRAGCELRFADLREGPSLHDVYFNYCRIHQDYRDALQRWCKHHNHHGIAEAGSERHIFIASPGGSLALLDQLRLA